MDEESMEEGEDEDEAESAHGMPEEGIVIYGSRLH